MPLCTHNCRPTQRLMLAVPSVAALLAAPAWAHDEPIVIGRNAASPPRIVFDGPSDLFDGSEPIELPPGDAGFAGLWVHDDPAFITLDVDRPDIGMFPLAPGHSLALRLITADAPLRFFNPATFDPILQDDGSEFVFAHDANGQFEINLLSGSTDPGTFAATFQFTDLSGANLDSAPFTIRFQTVPTPASITIAILAGIAASPRQRRRSWPSPTALRGRKSCPT